MTRSGSPIRLHDVSLGGMDYTVLSAGGTPLRIRRVTPPAILWERGGKVSPLVDELLKAASLAPA